MYDQSSFQDVDYRLWVLLNFTRESILKARNAELSKYGISSAEARALVVISDIGDDSATPAEVSRRMFREHPTVMALLRRMEKKGLVAMASIGEGGKCAWRVVLTEKGRSAYRQAAKLESIHSAMSRLSDRKKSLLEQFLNDMHEDALRQMVKGPAFESRSD